MATALYRIRSAARDLLYIGISDNPWVRFTQHSAEKPWWSEAIHVEIEWYPAREVAEQAERDAIRAEHPRHNIRHALSAEAQAALAIAVAAAWRAEALKTEAWEAIRAAREAKVLDTDLTGDRTPPRFNRATLNRRYGARPS